MITDYTLKYVNSFGDVLLLTDGANYANYRALPSWTLEAVTLNGRISGLRRPTPTYTIPVNVLGEGTQDGIIAKNRLYEIPARDVDANAPGRLYFNDWYIEGFMTASEADNFWQTKKAAQFTLKFTATVHEWVRETERNYTEKYTPVGEFLDFPFDYSYDYGISREIFTISNPNYSESPIMLRIFGDVENPYVTIGNNLYRVNVSLAAGEYLEINGFDYTVTIARANGARENAFKYVTGNFQKGSGSFIFQPIPSGTSEVIWGGNFDFDIVTYEVRSEPRWS